MISAINLYNEPLLHESKINNNTSHYMLAPGLCTQLIISDMFPQKAFCFSYFLSVCPAEFFKSSPGSFISALKVLSAETPLSGKRGIGGGTPLSGRRGIGGGAPLSGRRGVGGEAYTKINLCPIRFTNPVGLHFLHRFTEIHCCQSFQQSLCIFSNAQVPLTQSFLLHGITAALTYSI